MTLHNVLANIRAGSCAITIVIPRKKRSQLEYAIHEPTLGMNPRVERARNGTLYTYPNKAVVKIRMAVGMEPPTYNLLKMKAKDMTAWFKGETEVKNPDQEIKDTRDTR